MIDILKNLIDLGMQFISGIYHLKIEFTTGRFVNIGDVAVAFVFFVLALYLLLKGLGIIGGDD